MKTAQVPENHAEFWELWIGCGSGFFGATSRSGWRITTVDCSGVSPMKKSYNI